MKKLLLLSASLSFLISCKSKESTDITKADVLAANVDTTKNPSQDFFEFAHGAWLKNNPIPAAESVWGIGSLVVEENRKRLKEINEKAAKEGGSQGSISQKIGDFWTTAMDSTGIEKAGIKPIELLLGEVNAIKDTPSLLNTIGSFDRKGINSLIGGYVGQDDKQSTKMAYKLWQVGLGLPEREYYFKSDSSSKNIRESYVKYMAKMLELLGEDASKTPDFAKNLMDVETKIAKIHRKLEDLRDPYANYNKLPIAELSKLAPSIDWKAYFTKTGLKNIDTVLVGQPEYYREVSNLLKIVPLETWKNYLKFRVGNSFAGYLPYRFGIEAFNFSKLLSGVKERKPRWKRVIGVEEGVLGEALGQLYVKEFFNEKTKKRYEDLVENIKAAYKIRIENLPWMSQETKQKALAKLASIKKKVGFPDKWKDFSAMDIRNDSYAENMMRANEWWTDYEYNKLSKPVDYDEWDMSPQTYNAYYDPSKNEIVLPAGIFTVPGYRDEELDDATVYGYAGASTIGHEITHGFDDQGRQYDAVGNLSNWWTKKDEEEFNKRANVMVEQFNNIVVIDGMKINGKATLGENIADLGGILLGLDAFKQTEQFKKNEKLGGFTPLQRYFMGYALGWLGHERDEHLKNQLMVDVHSPAKYRVNGMFVSVDDFYKAFDIKKGSPMYLDEAKRVRIW